MEFVAKFEKEFDAGERTQEVAAGPQDRTKIKACCKGPETAREKGAGSREKDRGA